MACAILDVVAAFACTLYLAACSVILVVLLFPFYGWGADRRSPRDEAADRHDPKYPPVFWVGLSRTVKEPSAKLSVRDQVPREACGWKHDVFGLRSAPRGTLSLLRQLWLGGALCPRTPEIQGRGHVTVALLFFATGYSLRFASCSFRSSRSFQGLWGGLFDLAQLVLILVLSHAGGIPCIDRC